MMTIPPLMLNSPNSPQQVRLRRQLHYGEHDILLNAQPINHTLPHHALIRFPGPGHATDIFWALPSEDDFEPIDGQKLSGTPLGHLSSTLIKQLYTEFTNLFSSPRSPSFTNDPEIKTFPRVRHLFSQLSVPSLFQQAVMRWRIAQHMILLIDARITWLVEVMPMFAEPDAWKVHTLRNVVGAVTEDPLAVEQLYWAGIPVWFYRGLDVSSTVKVQNWIKEEDNPPCDHYRKMAEECWTIASPAAIFGADLIHNNVDYSVKSTASSSTSTKLSTLSGSTGNSDSNALAAGPSCTRSPSSASSSQPHKKQKTTNNPPGVQRNKFLKPNSPIMPHAFPKWVEAALSLLHHFKVDEQPQPGVNCGYVLPEPAVFANHQNEVSRAQYFLTYLKVHRVFIAAINLLGPIVCQRSAKDWRRLLLLELHGSLHTNTHEGTARLRLCNEMNEVAARMGSSFSIDLTDLSLASASWKGHIYTGRLPDDMQTEVLQEIFEISFKQEFMLLDRFLYRLVLRSQGREDGEFENEYDASTQEDQNLVIEDAFFSNGPPAFGH
ncbi:hypothetical protein BDP27DRAFT_1435480 [Rhodocollybia butyracea]|uniref:Uncharacterized protein n=1 Tax=Rhodocollybia butyracea TaxID=206335 RepID=A0A9P5TWJ2_9AGAR|nr:hypothetical protein BDP27DRAFT_1435480 [Rhodocollybia butyracea]